MPGTTDDLMAAVQAPALEQPTIRGELRVDHIGPEGRIAGKVYAFAAAGGRLRLEAVSPLDTPLRTVAVDADFFSLVDRESHRCLQGPAEPCLVGEAVGLELSAGHVAAALLGAVPLIEHREVESSWNRCGYYEIELQGVEDGWTELLRLEPRQGRLVTTEATVTGPEGPVMEIELGQYEPSGDRLVPRQIRLAMPLSEADLRVEWRELEVGVELPESAWRAACPAGTPVEQATCRSRSELPDLLPPGGRRSEEPEEAPAEEPEEAPGEEPDLSEELGF